MEEPHAPVVAIPGKSVDTCPQQKMGPGILGDGEQLINVALTVTNMDKALWSGKQRRRLLQIFKPAITLFPLDGNAGWVDRALQSIGSIKFVAGPELDGGQTERKSFVRDDQAGVHENTRGRMVTRTVIASLQFMNDSDRVGFFAAIDELSCVMQDEHRICVSTSDLLGKLPKQSAEPLAVPNILKLAASHLAFQPTPNLFILRLHASSPADPHKD